MSRATRRGGSPTPGPPRAGAREPDLAGKRARERLERVAAGSNTCRRPGRPPGRPRRPTASAARPRRSGRRWRRSRATRASLARAGGAPRSSRRRRHRTTPARAREPGDLGVGRGDPDDDSSTEANRVRSARPRPGATVDDVSAGVRSAGSGMIARIRSSARGRSAPAVAVGARSVRVSARSASSRERARWSAEPTTSRSGCGPAPASQPRSSASRALEAARSVGSNRPRAAAATSVASIAPSRPRIGGRQQQVDAGPDRGDDLDRLARRPGRARACRARR